MDQSITGFDVETMRVLRAVEKVLEGEGLARKQYALATALWRATSQHPAIMGTVDMDVSAITLHDGGRRIHLDMAVFPPRAEAAAEHVRTNITVATDFTSIPGGRRRTDDPWSGQRFREDLLEPALRKGRVCVYLDGTLGYGSSFLEEAFGELRRNGFVLADLYTDLTIYSKDPSLVEECWQYIRRE